METCRAGIEWVRGHYPEVHHSEAHDEKTDFHLLSRLDVGHTTCFYVEILGGRGSCVEIKDARCIPE